ncbi:hypothetical protein ACFQI7_36360 [Paenibacillus allorhizosphaerae]|uniref:DUF2964 family protein n=1 Tax=Paenibacillus allorhizosphaerae TaxID=2849866 RepID=A0ABM8VUD2_9BACL|nr:hypothetical protein [Paenibacillus allorhizosphaerae]CAG7658729.1 hypothetical protein PAECIP111802_07144 [Paenibacillus allorhizosphaerae]
MIGKVGMICGLCMIASGVIGGLFGAKEQGYELGAATCIVIMGVAVLLNQKQREGNRNRV